MRLLFTLLTLVLLSSCYRMPDPDHISTIPMTNNPRVVPQKGGSLPGLSY